MILAAAAAGYGLLVAPKETLTLALLGVMGFVGVAGFCILLDLLK